MAQIDSEVDRSTARRPVGGPTKSQSTNAIAPQTETSSSSNTLTKKNKPKPFSLLSRTKSIRGDEQSPRDISPNNKHLELDRMNGQGNSIKTAPLRSDNDRSFRDMMSSNVR